MRILIIQSNYIPWKGYFDNIKACDVIVIYDDMQYTKGDWRNRNYIKTAQGLKWLTIPIEVKGKLFQKINKAEVSNAEWNVKHWEQLKQVYAKAPYFKELKSWVEELYLTCTYTTLTEINVHFLKAICAFLDIKTRFVDSREFNLVGDRTERLVSICKELNATEYFSGPAAKIYLDESLFDQEGIKVVYADYSGYKEYNQLHEPFEHGVCIWDLIFNTGKDAVNYLKY